MKLFTINRLNKLLLCTCAMLGLNSASTIVTDEDDYFRTTGPKGRPDISEQNKRALENYKSLRQGDETDLLEYYTYPFDMPCNPRAITSTVVLRSDNPLQQPTILNNHLDIIRNIIKQFIIKGDPDFELLSQLAQGNHVDVDATGYMFHIQTVQRTAHSVLTRLLNVIESWAQIQPPQAEIQHLDIAISGLQDQQQRHEVVQSIVKLINHPAAANLKSLSLRFMHLTTGNLQTIIQALQPGNGAARQLERLILSFNDIDDDALAEGGTLTGLIEDITRFPRLNYLDLRGNQLVNPSRWQLCVSLYRRNIGDFAPIRLEYNQGRNNDLLTRTRIKDQNILGTVLHKLSVESPELTSSDVFTIKDAFDGRVNIDVLPSGWLSGGDKYENIADFILLLQGGQHVNWRKVELINLRLDPGDVIDFLSFIPDRTKLEQLKLKAALKNSATNTTHRYLTEIIRRFPSLQVLLLSNNEITKEFLSYYSNILRTTPFGLSQLQLLDMSGNPFGNYGVTDQDVIVRVVQFLGALGARMSSHTALRTIKFSNTNLCSADIRAVIAMCTLGLGKLSFVDLSDNYLIFADDDIRSLISLLNDASNVQNQLRKLVELDLTGNRMPEAAHNAIVKAYKARVLEAPSRFFPIIRINALQGDSTHGVISEIGSASAFEERARSFDQYNQDSRTRYSLVQSPNSQRAANDYVRAIELAVEQRIQGVTALLNNEIPIPVGEIPDLNDADINLRYTAEAILRSLGSAMNNTITSDTINFRARLLKYRIRNAATNTPISRTYFKTLSDIEQRSWIQDELNVRLAAQRSLDSREVLEAVLAKVDSSLDRLVFVSSNRNSVPEANEEQKD